MTLDRPIVRRSKARGTRIRQEDGQEDEETEDQEDEDEDEEDQEDQEDEAEEDQEDAEPGGGPRGRGRGSQEWQSGN